MGNVWRDARSIPDLGHAMAGWLEGRIPSWPGYDGPFGQEETNGARHLVPTLIALNRAGFVTVNSQPGTEGRGYDGAHWRQKAYLEGYLDDRSPFLVHVVRSVESAGMVVVRGTRRPARPIPFTDRDGEPVAGISVRLPRNQMAREWHGIGRQAMRDLRSRGVRLTLIDPIWGRDDRLWPALIGAVR
ncbi:DUF6919 domain-containing protein [Streptomyces sp. WAC01280]|uniref:DUF6919 domain-containing protein n=1 Tax=Streptomyces sp. WAC01280 TaxID=2487424 RepID=UPI000F78C65A|nr:hypothetical protein [Streptomyces sp. WAC01280]RSS59808.1 hypothetical protein EF909_08075 [Streptomyces sp. WAC01280]